MFIPVYLTIIIVLFSYKTVGVEKVIGDNDRDSGWGLFLSVSQGNDEYPSYDIGHWTQQLHLQQCAFVEIGEEFCALFVELRSIPSAEKIQDSSGVGEFFLGLCECSTVRSWILCSDQLMRRRKSDCIFTEALPTANTSARVHRRLCDVTLLTKYAQPCNCSIPMANQQLYRTEGFPTCFRSPLPESICSPRGICGIARCCATTIRGIHSPQCDPECHEKQPFCEEVGPWTSIPPEITSLWSHWSTPICKKNGGRVFSTATAICLNQVTRRPAIDCIGPGSFCCPADTERCTCIVTNENGILKATRIIESMPCTLSFKRDGARYSQQDSVHNGNYEEIYDDESTLGERMEYHQSYSEQEDVRNPWHRRLLFSSYEYSEDQDHSFDEGVEFAALEDTPVNEDEGSDKGDDKEDDKGNDKEDDKGNDKDDDKGNDKDDDKGNDKGDDKGNDKDDDKGNDKGDDKGIDESDDKTGDKGDDKSDEKGDDKDDKGDDKYEDKRDENDDNKSDDSGDNKANENADDDDDNDNDNGDEDDDDVDEDTSEEDANLDDELEEDEEDSTESSEDSEYVRRGRDPSMKNYNVKWSNEQPSRLFRSNPSMDTLFSERKNKRGPADAGTNDKCEEEDSTSIKGPLIYSDYDPDSDAGDDEETSGEDYNEEASSLAVIGQTLSLYPFYYLSTYACIALFT